VTFLFNEFARGIFSSARNLFYGVSSKGGDAWDVGDGCGEVDALLDEVKVYRLEGFHETVFIQNPWIHLQKSFHLCMYRV
jgi:hypothetical protein